MRRKPTFPCYNPAIFILPLGIGFSLTILGPFSPLLPLSAAETETTLPTATTLQPEQITEYSELSPQRQQIISNALKLTAEHGKLPYQYGGETPSEGGFDCSGFIHYLLTNLDPPIQPPRTSAGQHDWLKKAKTLHPNTDQAADLQDPYFKNLTPGDLLFWSGTTKSGGRRISHVALFLGHEADGRPIMINSSSGRSYRGERQEGLTVVDFKLPRSTSSAKFQGYGSLPSLD